MNEIYLPAIVVALVEGLKRVGVKDILIYPSALVIGIVISILGTTGVTLQELIIRGLVYGLSAVGLYEGVKRIPVANKLLKTE